MLKTKIKIEVYRAEVWVVMLEDGFTEAAVADVAKLIGTQFEPGEWDQTDARMVSGSKAEAMVFKPSKNLLRNIVHEVSHYVIRLMTHRGLPINDESSEAFCYMTDWLFGKVHFFLNHKL